MTETLHPSARRVQDALHALGFDYRVVELPQSTRSAVEAARAVGCDVEQIAKSLVFCGKETGDPVLVIAGGGNRVSEEAVAALIGEAITKPDADYVRERTGYVIGGVPPVGHTTALRTVIDEDLWQHEEIWAAAGHPRAVFCLRPDDLIAMTGGRVARIRR
ncbi:MAG TPA: YbaK/EbsC family protein [Chloroflexi bacterium]|jgi:Cys-tRNA(Pro) deacylase|nr:YbaK/EbsC family protein [Chloroflexota bacterium]